VSKSENQLPDDAVLLAYIEASEKPPKLRDIARHFQLSPAQRPALRARLHELATRQTTEFSKETKQADLPEIVLIDIIDIDTDGVGIGVIAGQTAEDQPRIEILPDIKTAAP